MDAGSLTPELVQKCADNVIRLCINDTLVSDVKVKHLRVGTPAPHLSRTPFTFVLITQGVFLVYPQQMYTVEWEGLGRFELFLVPVGPDPEGMQYEAVFG